MKRVKPTLLSAESRRGGGGFKFVLVFIVAFVFGVLVGMRVSSIKNTKAVDTKPKVADSQTDVQNDKKTYGGSVVAGEGSNADERSGVEAAATDPANPANDETVVVDAEAVNKSESTDESPSENESSGEDVVKPDVKYTLQIAAFRGIDRAQVLVEELKAKGYYAYITNSQGNSWNLIRVGKFETKEEAQDFAALFIEREGMEGIVKELDVTASEEFGR